MCYNCGCQNIQDDMGSANNITEQTLESLSKKWNKSLSETKKTIFEFLDKNTKDPQLEDLFGKASGAWGQSVDEAKKNTLELLKSQV
ncbi:hypothetical protein HYT32_00725 [Candidatus Roizmanbacteria bacterium]|nr:hypothetical protein [Candidatus Roizmanbacteria bacterium]